MNTSSIAKHQHINAVLKIITVLLCFIAISYVNAVTPEVESNPRWAFEYQLAVNNARSSPKTAGSIIYVHKSEALAQEAYIPKNPDLAKSFGPGVRFVRTKGMGDKAYKKFVTEYSALLDEVVQRSPSFARTLRDMSNNKKRIDFSKFNQGDKTVLAILPTREDRATSTNRANGRSPSGTSALADINPQYSGNHKLLGKRQGIGIDAAAGESAPSRVFVAPHHLTEFTSTMRTLNANGNNFSAIDPATIERYNNALKAVAHEFSHSSAFFNGMSFNSTAALEEAAKLKVLDRADRNAVRKLVAYFEEFENIGLKPSIGRGITENLVADEIIDNGFREINPSFRKTYRYGKLDASRVLRYMTGSADISGLPRVSSKQRRAILAIMEILDNSISKYLIESGIAIDSLGVHQHLRQLLGLIEDACLLEV